MMGIKKSTDAGLSTAERKSLRVSEAQEAMSDHDDAQKAFQENRERLRERGWHARPWLVRCFIQLRGFRTKRPSTTSDFPPGSGARSMRRA